MDLFVEGKIDAFVAGPPELQEVRTRNIGHVIVSSITDRPWSQYYCCMLATHTEFARNYPIATKRALRAILNAPTPSARRDSSSSKGTRSVTTMRCWHWARSAMTFGGTTTQRDTLRFLQQHQTVSGSSHAQSDRLLGQGACGRAAAGSHRDPL
jgi:hypothetical protein